MKYLLITFLHFIIYGRAVVPITENFTHLQIQLFHVDLDPFLCLTTHLKGNSIVLQKNLNQIIIAINH